MREYSEAMGALLKQVMVSEEVEAYVKRNLPKLYDTTFVEVDGMVLWEGALNTRWGRLEKVPSWKNQCNYEAEVEYRIYNFLEFNEYIEELLGLKGYIEESLSFSQLLNIAFCIYNQWKKIVKESFPHYNFYFQIHYEEKEDLFVIHFHRIRSNQPLGSRDMYKDKNGPVLVDII